ncbi:endonuclease/exonuclease/phosphatase family protein [Actinotalea sp.]|uniref:endonuclease/exonuclease/phosphatase family protein n=1 Tax=Actinotalea sp. TaxID=1872145 RepID=UPI003563027D
MSLNVRGLRDDRAALVRLLRENAPDVVALQEPPRGPFAGSRLRRVARAADLRVAVAGHGSRTTALLVRADEPPVPGRSVRLPRAGGRVRRGAVLADLRGVRVVGVHLGLHAAERQDHVRRVLALVREAPGPCVVAGDLNESPAGTAARRLTAVLRDAAAGAGPTYPARDPAHRIDVVLVSPGIVVESAAVLRGPDASSASDHLPVVVDLRIGERR